MSDLSHLNVSIQAGFDSVEEIFTATMNEDLDISENEVISLLQAKKNGKVVHQIHPHLNRKNY